MMSAIRKAVTEPSNKSATISSIATVVFAVLTFLSGVSYDLGPIALVIPVKYKPTVTWIAGAATFVLWVYNEIQKSMIRQDTAKQLKRRH